MRLRYLHFPRCGPLEDVAIVFGQEERIYEFLREESRAGTLNFLVGVNGSGKSSILRALYQSFLRLQERQWPSLPMTLAWDAGPQGREKTTVVHFNNDKNTVSFFAQQDRNKTPHDVRSWREWVHELSQKNYNGEKTGRYKDGRDALGDGALGAHLPKRIIAYTSGSDELWQFLEHKELEVDDLEEGQLEAEAERPIYWSHLKEWERDRDERLEEFCTKTIKDDSVEHIGGVLGLTDSYKSWRDHQWRDLLDRNHFHIHPSELRLSGIVMSLIQSAEDLRDKTNDIAIEALRRQFCHQRQTNESTSGARRILNKIDWFYPTHLSLIYSDDEHTQKEHSEELVLLLALADEVISQPSGFKRAVIPLAAIDNLNLTEKLKDIYVQGLPSARIENIAENRIDGSKTGAEAVLKVFSTEDDFRDSALAVFYRLREWQVSGLLKDITLTVRRIDEPSREDEFVSRPVIVHFDHLSDGEQMLLGRMGLMFLLRGQEDSLLMLDEPETHFNDVWKREIVEMMDTALLNETDAAVLLATHTSIALTDAFAAEVTVLDKTESGVAARGVKGGLFGTEPGEVAMNLFRAENSTGKRSAEILDRLLKSDWREREDELEELLKLLGSSFHRAELRAELKRLKNK